jgi:Fe-S cluster assembly ATP-binding protein
MALSGKKNPLQIRQEANKAAEELKINPELLSRSLNDGASGGEKKKLEVLQAAVLDKDLLIFDEVDTGVDVDALKTISQYLKKHQGNKTYIIITHYNRILHYLKPDKVLVIANGELKKIGDAALAEEIEKNGYENVIS